MSTASQAVIKAIPAGWERDAFIAWLQRGSDVIVTDMTDCPSGVPVHVIVKRASGFMAGRNLPSLEEAGKFAAECNAEAPSDRAHVMAWDDSVWIALLESEQS